MAHLAGIVGGNSEVREKYLASLKPSLTPFSGLSFGQASSENASWAWSVSPSAPLQTFSAEGSFGLVLGTFEGGSNTSSNTAEHAVRLRREKSPQALSGLNGYYLAFVLQPDGSIALGNDVLGLFPLYYYSTSEFFLFSTTPGVFKHYPGFSPELSHEGLAGLLTTGVISGGQTLFKGVRRLSSDHALFWRPGEAARELPAHRLVLSDRYFGESFDKNVERMDGVLSEAVKRNAKGSSAILLSGGLDARLVAGYLHEAEGKNVVALTHGFEDDIEMETAARVADSLGWRHEKAAPVLDSFETDALLRLDLEHLASGFNMTLFSQLVPRLRAFSRPVFSGAYGDSVLGGASSMRLADTRDFESYFRDAAQDAFTPQTVRQLIRPDILRDGLEHAIENMRKVFDSCAGGPFQRAWLCDLILFDRPRVMFPWVTAFGGWPALPFADRNVLETLAGIPPSSMAGRRIQIELLCRRFRPLSLLPLDRNSYNTAPAFGLKRLLRQRKTSGPETLKILKAHMAARLGGPLLQWRDQFVRKDRRYYYRLLDIHHAGWQRLRRRAETARPRMESIFDAPTLRRFWPGPESPLTLKDGITDAHKTKLFIGLALWMERNLS